MREQLPLLSPVLVPRAVLVCRASLSKGVMAVPRSKRAGSGLSLDSCSRPVCTGAGRRRRRLGPPRPLPPLAMALALAVAASAFAAGGRGTTSSAPGVPPPPPPARPRAVGGPTGSSAGLGLARLVEFTTPEGHDRDLVLYDGETANEAATRFAHEVLADTGEVLDADSVSEVADEIGPLASGEASLYFRPPSARGDNVPPWPPLVDGAVYLDGEMDPLAPWNGEEASPPVRARARPGAPAEDADVGPDRRGRLTYVRLAGGTAVSVWSCPGFEEEPAWRRECPPCARCLFHLSGPALTTAVAWRVEGGARPPGPGGDLPGCREDPVAPPSTAETVRLPVRLGLNGWFEAEARQVWGGGSGGSEVVGRRPPLSAAVPATPRTTTPPTFPSPRSW